MLCKLKSTNYTNAQQFIQKNIFHNDNGAHFHQFSSKRRTIHSAALLKQVMYQLVGASHGDGGGNGMKCASWWQVHFLYKLLPCNLYNCICKTCWFQETMEYSNSNNSRPISEDNQNKNIRFWKITPPHVPRGCHRYVGISKKCTGSTAVLANICSESLNFSNH